MSELDGLLSATSASSARKAGSSASAGWFMPSGAEAKKLNRSRWRRPSRASTSQEPRLARVSSTRSKPSTSRCRRRVSWTRSGRDHPSNCPGRRRFAQDAGRRGCPAKCHDVRRVADGSSARRPGPAAARAAGRRRPDDHGRSGSAVGLSRTAVLARVQRLERAGVIRGLPRGRRAARGGHGAPRPGRDRDPHPGRGRLRARLRRAARLDEIETVTGEYDLIVRVSAAERGRAGRRARPGAGLAGDRAHDDLDGAAPLPVRERNLGCRPRLPAGMVPGV